MSVKKITKKDSVETRRIKDWSKSTYSGADISVIATLNLRPTSAKFTKEGDTTLASLKGLVHDLGTVQTISCQAHRPKSPVRSLGNTQARGYTRGPRTIAGSMIFTVLNQHSLRELAREMEEKIYGNIAKQAIMLPDQILPIDLTFLFVNEYGGVSRMALYGVEFMNSGQTMSVEDLLLEEVIQFVALDMDPMSDADEVRTSNSINKQDKYKKGSYFLKRNFTRYQRLLERSGIRRSF